ncbi:hypothetical protein MSIMFI_05535 [Mycobacterium simulans]|nr:hypothetical protein MSIMFI_05535 [Mycobacterium simulans]
MIADPGISRRDLLDSTDIGLPDLHKPPTGGHQAQRGIHELPRQTVEHHIHPAPPGDHAELVSEIQAPRRGDPLRGHPELFQNVLLVRMRRRIHLRTHMHSDLDRGLTHPTSPGVDQHRLPRRQPPDLHQPDIGGQKRHRHRGRLLPRPPHRDSDDHVLVGDRRRSKPISREQPHHRITHPPGGHIRADLDHHPGSL